MHRVRQRGPGALPGLGDGSGAATRGPILFRTLACAVILVGLFAGSIAAVSAPDPPASPAKPASARSLVLITVEGLRPDYLSCYGKVSGRPTSNIDALASQGTLFETVVAPSVSSMPSLATILTGKTPFQHQVWDDDFRNHLAAGETTLAERLKQRGYRTGAFLGTSRAAADRGLDQGFDIYQDSYVPAPSGSWRLALRSAKKVIGGARSWISGLGQDPFFLWLHFADPAVPGQGNPLDPTPVDTYRSRVDLVDSVIGELMTLLKQRQDYDQIVVVLTGDHGFGLGEHGESRAGVFAYESTLRVPLILRTGASGGGKGKHERELCGLIDLYPTLEKLMGLPVTPGLTGRDLLGPSPTSPPSYHATALVGREVFGWAGSEALAQGKWRLIQGAATELYDLEADPAQTRDLSRERPEVVARLKQTARALAGGSPVPAAHFQVGPVPSATVRAQLKQKGLTDPSIERARARPLPDPKKFLDSIALFEEMQLRNEVVGYAAVAQFQAQLLKADPESLLILLGASLLSINTGEEGRTQARALLRTAQKLYPLESEVYHALGHLAFPEKRFGDAVLFLQAALGLDPRSRAEVVYDLACAYAREGKKAQALAQLKESIQLGFRDVQHIRTDPDLEILAQDPGFKKMMAEDFPPPSTP